MVKNYFKIAWRNIIKGGFYSAINIIGLSAGIAFTLLIAAYVWNELRVNKSLRNADQQYIIQSNWKDPNQGYFLATLGPLGKTLKENYPHLVANYYRFDGITSNVSKGSNSFREKIQIGDSTLLEMYGFRLLYGDARNALHEPYSAVITAEKAVKYFGRKDVVGQTLTIESFSGTKHDFLITGVLKDPGTNSVTSLVDNNPASLFVSSGHLEFFGRNMGWQNPFIVNFIELQKGVEPAAVEQAVKQLIKENAAPGIVNSLQPQLVSLQQFYLEANDGLVRKLVYALSAIALFILVMAVINFINMSMSRATERMKEIGIRKTLGGMKRQLMIQFLVESTLMVFTSTLLAFIIYLFIRNLFSSILIHPIPPLSAFPPSFILFPALFSVVLGFAAGIYPAFLLSSLKPVETLKGKPSIRENILMRKGLASFQFAIAVTAFIAAIIISRQVDLFLSKNLGYNKDYVMSAQLPRDWTKEGVNKMEHIRDEFLRVLSIADVSLSYEIPDGNNSGAIGVYHAGADSVTAITAQVLTTDERFLSVYQVPLSAGSFFEGRSLDSGKIVINESLARSLGWNDMTQAVGRQVRLPGDPTAFTIAGITSNFHFGSMKQKVAPIAFLNVHYAPIYRYLSFKLKPGSIGNTIGAIQQKWSALLPGSPFEYKFMDETLNNVYKSEIQLRKASYTATVLAFIIVLLGVIGLVSLSIRKRLKEIGIRKILGSPVTSIIYLFIKEFLWVIIMGGLVACPFAYILMHNWLENYAYRIHITATPFIISFICLALITALVICIQTIKAAVTNPVITLKGE